MSFNHKIVYIHRGPCVICGRWDGIVYCKDCWMLLCNQFAYLFGLEPVAALTKLGRQEMINQQRSKSRDHIE